MRSSQDDLRRVVTAKGPTYRGPTKDQPTKDPSVARGVGVQGRRDESVIFVVPVPMNQCAPPSSKRSNSQREHMQSHETGPRKTANPVTCGDCQCGPPKSSREIPWGEHEMI